MDNCADCTERGERSSTKLDKLHNCPGNEGSRIRLLSVRSVYLGRSIGYEKSGH